MFGQDDTQDDTNQVPTTIEPIDDSADDTAVADSGSTADTPLETPEASDETPTESTSEKTIEPLEASDTAETPAADASTQDDTPADEEPASTPLSGPSESSPAADDDLLEVKKEALTDLAPLIDHLDQPPEEQFKTVMMLIQATDDPTHVKSAYESAKKISDETARAQALLDVVNEINYFTQKS